MPILSQFYAKFATIFLGLTLSPPPFLFNVIKKAPLIITVIFIIMIMVNSSTNIMLAFNICIEQEDRLRAADGKAGNLHDRDHHHDHENGQHQHHPLPRLIFVTTITTAGSVNKFGQE